MNYFASGIENGLRIGADAYNRRKEREQQDALDKARRDLELQRDMGRYKSEKDRQDAQLAADAQRQFTQNVFTTNRDATLYGYDDAKLGKTQQFHAGESKLDRDMRIAQDAARLAQEKAHNEATLKNSQEQFGATNALHYAQLGLSATNAQRDDERRADPASPDNQLRNEKLIKIKRENSYSADLPLTGASGAPSKPLTPIDNQALAWARANPNDPKAAAILQRLGVK